MLQVPSGLHSLFLISTETFLQKLSTELFIIEKLENHGIAIQLIKL